MNVVDSSSYQSKKYVITHNVENQGIRFTVKIGGQKPLIFDPDMVYPTFGINNQPVWGKENEFLDDKFIISVSLDGKISPNSKQEKTKAMFDFFDSLLIEYCIKNINEMSSFFNVTSKTREDLIPEFVSSKLKNSFRPSEKALKNKVVDPRLNLSMQTGQFGKVKVTDKEGNPVIDPTTKKQVERMKTPTIEVFANSKFKCIKDDTREIRAGEQLPWKYIHSAGSESSTRWSCVPTIIWDGAFLNTTMLAPSYTCKRVRVTPDQSDMMTDAEKEYAKKKEREEKIEEGTEGINEAMGKLDIKGKYGFGDMDVETVKTK